MSIKAPNLLLFTDGSGHADGFGGYAAYVKTADDLVKHFCMGSCSDTSVDRMEFTALIEGLRMAMEMWMRFPEAWENAMSDNPVLRKPRVLWHSDRESLVLSVKNVYARDNCPDLWAAFAHFESVMEIEARHVTEPFTDTVSEFVEVDLQSSTGRDMMKNYYRQTPLRCDEELLKKRIKKTKT
jgi:ribonuclease HI